MPPTEYQVVSGDTLTGLAERFYGDGSLFPVISVINHLADPDQIDVGQKLLIPYVTFRHQVSIEDGKESLAQQFYHDPSLYEIIPIANHAAQRDFVVGEWLLIPDLANVDGHQVVSGETWEVLAERWYGESNLWPIIAIANHMENQEPPVGQAIIHPRLNWRHTVLDGDTLWQLAASYYGDTGDEERTKTTVGMVAAANHIDDPDQLQIGQVLFFPSFD
ncbi:MAG TPA: LysM peptidoglycan-binding domain-containing protein [Mycobacterium sp.]|jgi:nucleoid-associated protein YgaU